tara:strand:- start:24 stop:449 length:426 start_codon:yes stop_codon:yes gene_type:complete
MASQLKVDTLTGVTTAGSIVVTGEGNSTTTNLQQGLAKTWCVFDQVNSNTIDDSFNIGSVTDRGTGSLYGVYTNNMSSLHYTVMAASSSVASGSMSTTSANRSHLSSADTTSRYSLNVYSDSTRAMNDEENQQTLVHGDLA